MNVTIKKNAATRANTVKILPSLFRCIKIVRTRYAFTEAMINAVATVSPPILIPATATVNPVRTNNPIQTII